MLDEAPAAATDLNILDEWESLAPYKSSRITDIGSMTNPNLEKLLEVGPDLIIMVSARYGSYGDQLEKIAPVITVDSNENNWQGALREYGKFSAKSKRLRQKLHGLKH